MCTQGKFPSTVKHSLQLSERGWIGSTNWPSTGSNSMFVIDAKVTVLYLISTNRASRHALPLLGVPVCDTCIS
jgi:hypothetical protein